MKKEIVCIIGPTGIGKSDYAVDYAAKSGGEIISADAYQVYRGMDIGTAKMSIDDRQNIPHYLIDIKNPDESFDVAEFVYLAKKHVSDIHQRNQIPVFCGGTAFYLYAYLNGYSFPESTPSSVRSQIEDRLSQEGPDSLWQELNQKDPEAAQKIHPHNLPRLIRAHEILATSDRLPSQKSAQNKPIDFKIKLIGLTADRNQIYDRINQRVDRMIQAGLIDEVQRLVDRYDPAQPAFQALGYKQVIQYLQGDMDREEMIESIKKKSRHFAKRQSTWYNRFPNVNWHQIH